MTLHKPRKVNILSNVIRYKENPFVESMHIERKGKHITLSRLGRDDNVLINGATGEDFGTHVTAVKEVDASQFVKLFSQNIGLMFDLNKAGVKAFTVLMWSVQKAIKRDRVTLDALALEEFLASSTDLALSLKTLNRGIRELERAKVLAKTTRRGEYFINPGFCFNGDRLAFTTMIERKKDGA